MFILKKDNIIKNTSDETKKERLVALGYELLESEAPEEVTETQAPTDETETEKPKPSGRGRKNA